MEDSHEKFVFFIDVFLTSLIQYTISSMSGVSIILIKHFITTQEQLDYASEQIVESLNKSIVIALILAVYFYFKYDFMEALMSFMLNILIIHTIYESMRNEIVKDIKKNNLNYPKAFKNKLTITIFS